MAARARSSARIPFGISSAKVTKTYSRSVDSTYPAKVTVPFRVPVFAWISPTALGAVVINRSFKVPEMPLTGSDL